jgi:predicted metal-dependent hydrolase
MLLPEHYSLTRKDIKHARIKVNESGLVRIVVPHSFTEEDIAALIFKKKQWVEKQKAFFSKKVRITLSRNQLLLFGNRYHYFYDDTYKQKVLIDHQHKTIRSSRDLLVIDIQEKWYKSLAKRYLTIRTENLARQLGFEYGRIFVRNQKTKLGNCSSEKNISLNWRLIKAPNFVIDYIVVHELVHTKIMSHSGKFWILLKSHYPDYKAAIDWLDKYGNSL